jgi:hypothetical protein
MNLQKVDWQYEIRRVLYPDSIRIVREHSYDDALSLIDRYYMNFRDHISAEIFGRKIIKDSWYFQSNETKKSFPSFEDTCLRLEKFSKGLELFSYEDRKKVYGAFCEYYYEIFDKRCKSYKRSYVLLYLRNDFTHTARLWGITDSEGLNLFIENLRPLLEIINPYKETKRLFSRKVGF